jgi:hypothetical protein
MHSTRRDLLRWLTALAATSAAPPGLVQLGCKSSSPAPATTGGFFSADEARALGALANAVLPPGDGAPGGADLGAVQYVTALCTALDGDRPRILAGGPFSGRAGGTSDFQNFQALDRVSMAAWRLYLFGSKGAPGPNDAVLGPVVGLRDRMKDGLAAAIQGAPKALDEMSPDDLAFYFDQIEGSFRDLVIELVSEAAFSAPEYGGNPDLAGWKLVRFEGDVQPRGYTTWNDATQSYEERPEAPVSGPATGPDPAPLDDDTRAFIDQIVALTGGKKF